MARMETLQKIANVLVYVYLLTTTGYTVFAKGRIADIFHGYQTYFDPGKYCVFSSMMGLYLLVDILHDLATWVFLLWSLIHLLLAGFVIYQWSEAANEAAMQGVGWQFIISALLNSLWFALLENHRPILAFFVSLLLVGSVSVIYYNLEANHPTQTWLDKLFLHAPFSLWHGFTVFLAVVNGFVAFTKVKKNADGDIISPDLLHLILVYAALIFLALTAIGYVQYKHEKGDLTSAWAIAFGLWAVFAKQTDPLIHWPTLAAALLTTLWPAKPYLYSMMGISTRSSESAPLLST